MAIPFEGKDGSGSGTDGSTGGCGGGDDGRDGRNDGNDDQRNNDDRKPKDNLDEEEEVEEERNDQESNNNTNDDDEIDNIINNNPERLGAHGGGDLNSVQGYDDDDDIPNLPLPAPQQNLPEEAQETVALFRNILETELRQDGIEQIPDIAPNITQISAIPEWAYAGDSLQRVSQRLQSSPERERIRQRAAQVNLRELTFRNFRLLLGGLFQDGITIERIVVLFYFCSDLAVRAWREGAKGKFDTLIKWTMKYIMNKVSHWVHVQGGWTNAISRSVQDSQLSLCCAGLVALFTCVFLVTRS